MFITKKIYSPPNIISRKKVKVAREVTEIDSGHVVNLKTGFCYHPDLDWILVFYSTQLI